MNIEAETIRDQMALVRRSLNSDVADVVESAQDLVDWKGYVRRYPLAVLSAAVAAGFVLVPKASGSVKPSGDELAHLIRTNKKIVVSSPPASRGIVSTLVTLAATTALRTVMTNVGAKANDYFAHTQPVRKQTRTANALDEFQK